MASRKKSIQQRATEANEKLFRDLGAIDDGELCLLLRSSAHLGSSDLEVTAVHKLADGALVVHTVDDAYGPLEGHLMEEEVELVESHGDPRGVLAFPDARLEEVRACRDYENAVACVGKSGRWLVAPKTRRKYSEH